MVDTAELPRRSLRIAVSKESWSRAEAETCVTLPGYERREIEGVVVLRAYTDPDALADLLD